MAKIHEVKILPEHYAGVVSGKKKAELRFDDRNYAVGDITILREWTDGKYTGRRACVKITHILRGGGYGLAEGWAMLSISRFKEAKKHV